MHARMYAFSTLLELDSNRVTSTLTLTLVETVMANRTFLMLAHTYLDKKKHKPVKDVTRWWLSEKMDGIRAFWDGGISRGTLKSLVPWANNTDKDLRYVTTPLATGLWSRYGHPIMAPAWFLDRLPLFPLDGELFIGPRQWQLTSSTVGKLTPVDSEWEAVRLHAFDSPPLPSVFATGRINETNFMKDMMLDECMSFVRRVIPYTPRFPSFEQVQDMFSVGQENDSLRFVLQERIDSIETLETRLDDAVSRGCEGLMLRQNRSHWEAKRSHSLLKYKPNEDAEGTVTGFVWGRQTDKGSKLLGKLGALVLDFGGKRLELSGFTDSEREMVCLNDDASDEYNFRAGQSVTSAWTSRQFPIGSQVTFRYRELSDTGVPKEARYLRQRPVGV